MTYNAKGLLRKTLRFFGCDLVRYNQQQKDILKSQPNLHYRDFVAQESITLPVGEISLTEARFLGELAGGLKGGGPIIEIGTLFGYSTRILAAHKQEDREFITVDNYSWNPLGIPGDMHFAITQEVLGEAVKKFNVKQVKMGKDDFYLSYSGAPPSLVFLDANHAYEPTKADILWAKKARANLVTGHDYDPQKCPGVVRAVDEFGGPKELVDTIWLL